MSLQNVRFCVIILYASDAIYFIKGPYDVENGYGLISYFICIQMQRDGLSKVSFIFSASLLMVYLIDALIFLLPL